MDHTKVHTKSAIRAQLVRRAACWALALALAAIFPATISKALGADTYQVYMSSDYTLLMNPSATGSAANMAKQQSTNVVNTGYNNPVIELENKSSTASIKEVQFSLPAGSDSVFDALTILQGPAGAQKRFGTSGPFTSTTWGGKGQTIDIVLPTALAPNQSLVFAVNLAPLTGFPNPNWTPGYDNIFYQDPPATNTNASFKVLYTDGMTQNDFLPDLETMATNTSTDPAAFVLSSSCCNTQSTMFLTAGFNGGASVPEPSSVVLLVLGSLPIAVPAWRKYKRAAESRRK